MLTRLCDMRLAALLLLTSTLGGPNVAPVPQNAGATVIVGVVRTAVTRHPIANTLVYSNCAVIPSAANLTLLPQATCRPTCRYCVSWSMRPSF